MYRKGGEFHMISRKITPEQRERVKEAAIIRPLSILHDLKVFANGEEYILSVLIKKSEIIALQALHYGTASGVCCELITSGALLTALLEFVLSQLPCVPVAPAKNPTTLMTA